MCVCALEASVGIPMTQRRIPRGSSERCGGARRVCVSARLRAEGMRLSIDECFSVHT